jgi:hypothetical protein
LTGVVLVLDAVVAREVKSDEIVKAHRHRAVLRGKRMPAQRALRRGGHRPRQGAPTL